MQARRPIILLVAGWLLCTASAASAQEVRGRIGDVTHLQGQGTNRLVGMGLVTGLNKSGDSDSYFTMTRSLAGALKRMGTPIEDLQELEGTRNVAIVMLQTVIPEHGCREGDQFDVTVTALGDAKSLVGGQLLPTPLTYRDPTVKGLFGFAAGPITVSEDAPTSGRIFQGARMEQDVFMNVVATGSELIRIGFTSTWIQPSERYITLVLEENHAGWPMAVAVAQAVDHAMGISADVERVALAMDAKSVVVLLPRHQWQDPASWIRDVQRTPLLMESNEARVTINRKTQTIVVTGDTRVSPVIVSQAGLTVTIVNPQPDGTVPVPPFELQSFVAVDTEDDRAPNVQSLLEALNRLKVPFKDRVAILEEIHRAGKLHASMVYEG